MITNEDIQLSKMSYSQKDFGTIYPSLLDLAKLLTNKWDPSLSNESDPGVVLLKEGAFIADHTNYNIDKNVLESFLPSATQDSSVRNIVDMNGYNPRYYISATGDVSFTYQKDDDETFQAFGIPPFTLQVSNDEGTIVYTQISKLNIVEDRVSSTCQFMQGSPNWLLVDGSSTILLENLDENNRIYFPVQYVAQNGIYVASVDDTEDYWTRTDYLLTQPLKSTVYKVGYDSYKGVPYLEFPTDIATIIGSGLLIRYFTTQGESGNISSRTLTKIVSSTTYKSGSMEIDLTKMTLSNNSSFTNGKNPETIDEMYQSFKKIVGTFDTLVTRNDYTNAINAQTDDVSGKKLVSNSIVTDITNDYNHAEKIIAYDEYGPYFETAAFLSGIAGITFKFRSTIPTTPEKGDVYFDTETSAEPYYKYYDGTAWQPLPATLSYSTFVQATSTMSPFDLYVYAMQAYNASEYTDNKHWVAINNSFKPASTNAIGEAVTAIEDLKCVNHSFKQPEVGDVLFFKNYTPLYVTITPYSKVTEKERDSIINAVYKAISDNFNAEQLEFGTELSYDHVVQVLLNADSRIKNIRLENLQYTPKAVRKTESGYEEVNVYDTSNVNLLVDMIAKNILAGRLCLFEFDNEFKCEYAQITPSDTEDLVVNNIESITTEAVLPLTTRISSSQQDQTSTTFTYTQASGTNIYVTLTGNAQSVVLANNATYNLLGTETLTVKYNGSSSATTTDSVTYQNIDSNNYYQIKNTSGTLITLASGSEITIANNGLEVTYIQVAQAVSSATTLSTNLQDNEYLHIAYQSYSTDVLFPTYVNYRFVTIRDGGFIPANVDFKLEAGDQLIMIYTTNGAQQLKEYYAGEVIKSNFKIEPTTSGNGKNWTDQYGTYHEGDLFLILGANELIEHRVKMSTVLSSTATPCYWIRSNSSNNLFPDPYVGQYNTTILGSGEYFIYSNQNKDIFVILGAGTKLVGYVSDANDWVIEDAISIESIQEEGFESGLLWKYKDFSQKQFTINEQTVVTLGKGDNVTIYDWSTSEGSIGNTWVPCYGSIKYTLADGTSATLNALQEGYLLRSRLDIAVSSDSGQVLASNQKFYLKTSEQSSEVEYTNCCVKASESINAYGDTELDIKKLTNKTVNMTKYSTTNAECKAVYTTSGVVKTLEHVNGKVSVAIDNNLTATFPFMYRKGTNNRRYILPIFANLSDNISTGITVSVVDFATGNITYKIREYNSGAAYANSITISKKGMYLLDVDEDDIGSTAINMKLKIVSTNFNSSDEIVITCWDPVVYTGLNSNLTYDGLINLAGVATKIKQLVDSSTKSTTKPYYINTPESSIAIQDDDISNPNIFWDINNVANHITIPQVDVTGSNIDILKSMRNYT